MSNLGAWRRCFGGYLAVRLRASIAQPALLALHAHPPLSTPAIAAPKPRQTAGQLPWLLRSLLVALACFGAGQFGWALPGPWPLTSAFCPLAGVALAALLRWGPDMLPAVMLGALAANLAAGAPPWLAGAIALGNAGGPWAAERWMVRARFNSRLELQRDLWLLIVAGGLGASVISAAHTATWLVVAGRIAPQDLTVAALYAWVGNALGLFAAGVPLLTLSRRSLALAWRPGQRLRTACALAGTAAAAGAGLAAPASLAPAALGLLLMPQLLLCWLAMRTGLALASAAVLTLATAAIAATTAGFGPFAAPPGHGVLLLWAYLASLSALLQLSHLRVAELSRLDQRWQLAVEGADLGVAEWNLRTGLGVTSPRWRALMDDPRDDRSASLERWLSRLHADDREAVSAVLADAGATPGSGLRRELPLRVRERWCWFDLHLVVAERDTKGTPSRVVASLADISARRGAEDRQQLASSVFLQLHEGLIVTDAELRLLDANPSYCRIVGTPREALIGTVPSLLQPAADTSSQTQQASLMASLRNGGSWVGEVVERRRNGEACVLQVTASTITAPDGALRHHVLVVSDISEQRLQHEQLQRQAHFDELTRLPNRVRLGQLLAEAIAATDRDGYLLAVCYLDLDHFKVINEHHGQQAGDRLLAELAQRLRGALRARGAVWSDAAARLGGDEFVLLLRTGTVDEARSAIERVLRLVSRPVELRPDTGPMAVTASVGVTVYPLDSSDADTLLRHADHAMYGVKQSGRNGFLFFDPEHSRRSEERVLAVGRVQEALDRNELMLYYQPKVDLRRGVVLGMEALLRWNHPEHGVVPPLQFLPLIEHTGLSARVGDHVLSQALDQLEVWQNQGLDLSVSVNITARHLQEPDFAQRLAELLARHPQPLGQRLELEVLETAALTDIGLTSALLERCAQLGVRWALDDFGTGYSTLTYLKRLPVQVLKVDRSFVQNMLSDAQDRAIVEGVIGLSRTFGCVVVAEGVETAAQARMLLDMGCDVGQGTGIAAPMPAAEVGPWVREWKGLFALSAALTGSDTRPGVALR